METNRARRPSPTPPAAAVATAAAAAMSLVLGDDDLLREILLRVGLPTSLLRAALVCRRWCRHASAPAFLRRFRDRHPPRVLGAYLNLSSSPRPRFLPVRALPELAAAARRAGAFFDAFRGSSAFVRDSRGGRLLVTSYVEHYGDVDFTELVCSPLSAAGDAVVVPPSPPPPVGPVQLNDRQVVIVYHRGEFLPVNGGGDGRSYSCVLVGYGARRTVVLLYELQDMCWVIRASAAAQIPVTPPRLKVMLLDDTKFYILSTTNKILMFDFPSSSISAIDYPNGVENDDSRRSFMLSRAGGGGSGIFLIHVKGSLLRVFRCRTDGDDPGRWSVIDNICLRKVGDNLGMDMTAWTSTEKERDAGVEIHAAGDGARFVFLEMFRAVVFLDIASRQAEKVCEVRPENDELFGVHPLTMIWHQPVFPVLKEG